METSNLLTEKHFISALKELEKLKTDIKFQSTRVLSTIQLIQQKLVQCKAHTTTSSTRVTQNSTSDLGQFESQVLTLSESFPQLSLAVLRRVVEKSNGDVIQSADHIVSLLAVADADGCDPESFINSAFNQSSQEPIPSTSEPVNRSEIQQNFDPMLFLGLDDIKKDSQSEIAKAEEELMATYDYQTKLEYVLRNQQRNALNSQSSTTATTNNEDVGAQPGFSDVGGVQIERTTPLYCDGEDRDTVTSDDNSDTAVKRYIIHPTKTYSLNAIGEAEHSIHFAIVDSQIRRTSRNQHCCDSVMYVSNRRLYRRWQKKKIDMARKHRFILESMKSFLVFHGTRPQNLIPITQTNFTLSRIGSNTGNQGYYGKGIYFSELPSYSLSYSASMWLILSRVYVGKPNKLQSMSVGCDLVEGYDSHTSPCGGEIVVFDTDQILPCYIVKLRATNGYSAYTALKVDGLW